MSSTTRGLNWLPGRIVRRTSGPWVDRVIAEYEDAHTWVEIPRSGSPYDAARVSRAVRTLADVLGPDVRDWLCLPDPREIDAHGVFVYRSVVRAPTLYECLEDADRASPELFTVLGRRLAELHETPLERRGSSPFERRVPDPAVDLLCGGEGPAHLVAARDALGRTPLLRELATEAAATRGGSLSLLHGRWTSGVWLCPPGEPECAVALGGVDAHLGPAVRDVGYFVGELIEWAADAALRDDAWGLHRALDAVSVFVSGYRERRWLCPERTMAHAARRVLAHIALNGRWRQLTERPVVSFDEALALFASVEALIDFVQARLARTGRSDG